MLRLLLRVQGIILAIQLLVGIWCRFFPMEKITDPSKKLVMGCCYHSKLAESSQTLWDTAQLRYGRWCLVLLPISAAANFLICLLLLKALTKSSSLLGMSLAIVIPVLSLFFSRLLTERDLSKIARNNPE